jgi:ankyrin repeat protein
LKRYVISVVIMVLIYAFLFGCRESEESKLRKMGFGFEGIDFINAVKENNLKAVELFIQGGISINSVDPHGASAIFYATQKEDSGMLRYLIGAGAETMITDNSKRSPLHYAVTSNRSEPVLILLQKGADPNWKDNFERDVLTAYLRNTEEENVEIVNALINSGADVNSRDVDRGTPLIYAAKKNFYETTKILLEKKASTIAKDHAGKTALDYVLESYEENPGESGLLEMLSDKTLKEKEKMN